MNHTYQPTREDIDRMHDTTIDDMEAIFGSPDPKPNTYQLVKRLKADDQDFEWYPTTDEIINLVRSRCDERDSILDCGAGDGRVLTGLTKKSGDMYAIEKAIPLIQAMPSEVVIIGTEFFQSTLIDKPVDIVFCNPPYSEYESWATKIITEAHAKKAFLVIPTRWKDSPAIQAAIEKRSAKVSTIGTFDFLNADRAARCKVDVLQINLSKNKYGQTEKNDPFNLWFDNEFNFDKKEDIPRESKKSTTLKDKLDKAVVGGRGKVPVLVELYNHDMQHLHNNFKQISALDSTLLKELGTSKDSIMAALKLRITGLKNTYWQELFNNLDDITNRLTTKSRASMLDKLTARTNVDFTESNIYAILIWVIKNANKYYDNQLIDMVEDIVSAANVVNYKSNQKVYNFDKWRYADDQDICTHYGLELRIVLERYRAIAVKDAYGYVSTWDFPQNLHTTAHNLINDLVTIGNNLNFICPSFVNSHQMGDWVSNKTKNFKINPAKNEILMSVKAFKNGNLHIKFNQSFIKRLNVEFGRLKGWLKDEYEAAEELNIKPSEAAESFGSNKQLSINNVKLLTY